jgi:membrane protein YdbS with pleckstrin-like domain
MAEKKKLPPERNNAMYAFNLYPRMEFENQWKNENIILVLRASPFTLIPWILNAVLFFFLLIVLNFFFPAFLTVTQILFLDVFAIVGITSYVWVNFLIWYFNVGIVTNVRVIDIDFHGILFREFTQAELKQITDVTARTIGFAQSFFNFGNVYIKTEGFQQNIEFLNTPKANKVVDIINRLLRNPDAYDQF